MWPARQGESVSRTSHLGFVLAYVLKQASRVIGDRADPSARFEPQGQKMPFSLREAEPRRAKINA